MSKISKERKVTYYIGMACMIVGFLLFMSVFFAGFAAVNSPFASSRSFSFTNAPLGMLLMIIGAVLTNIGAKGAAGSGVILDPDKAREDLKPFHEAKGGMINDVISNIDIIDDLVKPSTEKEVIKIRCGACKELNDEDARYCKACGNPL